MNKGAIIFAILKEKGAILISGFNTLPKEEREKYDKLKMSKDIRNTFLAGLLYLQLGQFYAVFCLPILQWFHLLFGWCYFLKRFI